MEAEQGTDCRQREQDTQLVAKLQKDGAFLAVPVRNPSTNRRKRIGKREYLKMLADEETDLLNRIAKLEQQIITKEAENVTLRRELQFFSWVRPRPISGPVALTAPVSSLEETN